MLARKSFAANKLALLIAVISSPSFAQTEENSDSDFRLEEIIVTSQKITQSLQDVPISVASIKGEKLDDAGIENLEDLTVFLPSIHFTETGISTQVRVRGIGSDNSQGFEQSVGMYVDDVYYGRAQLFRTPMMDMERVELLRGPQTTLFGKNSIAGALNLTTAKPTEEFEGSLNMSHETQYNTNEVSAVVSGPISDTFRARIAFRNYEDEGYFKNTYKDLNEPNSEEQAARLTLDWTPTDDLQFLLKAENNTFETFGRPVEMTLDEPIIFTYPGQTDDANATYAQTLSLLSVPTIESEQNYERQADTQEFSDNDITNITLTTKYNFNDHELTLVTSQLGFEYKEFCDCDFTAAEILDLELNEEYDQFSQEIRLTSPQGQTVEWIAGLYYQDYDQTFTDDLTILDSNLLPNLQASLEPMADTVAARDFEQTSDSWAIFGRATWHMTNSVSTTLGARYTEEDKIASKRLYIYDALTGTEINDPLVGFVYLNIFKFESEAATLDFRPVAQGNPPVPLQNSGYDISDERNESAFTPFINVEFDINDDIMTYATFKTGFKAGGYDPRSNNVGVYALDTSGEVEDESNRTRNFEFEEEKAQAAEVGIKTTLADGRGELNVALYRTDYENLQISQFDGGVGFNVGNAKETRVQGVELDGRWLIAEGLTTRYGLSLLDFEYVDFENGNCNTQNARDPSVGTADLDGDLVVENGLVTAGDYELCSYTGKRGVYTPEYTINLGFDYSRPITGKMRFISFLDSQYVDGHMVHVNLDPKGEIDAYTMLSAKIAIATDTWSVGILGKNLLDEEVVTYSANAPLSDSQFGTNTHYSFVRRPMTISLEAQLKF